MPKIMQPKVAELRIRANRAAAVPYEAAAPAVGVTRDGPRTTSWVAEAVGAAEAVAEAVERWAAVAECLLSRWVPYWA